MIIAVEGGEIVSALLNGNMYIPMPPKLVFITGLLFISGIATNVPGFEAAAESTCAIEKEQKKNSNSARNKKYFTFIILNYHCPVIFFGSSNSFI